MLIDAIENLLQRTGKLHGWSFRSTSIHSQGNVFWFHLEEDEKVLLAFDWYADIPNVVIPKGPHRRPLTGRRFKNIEIGDPINLNHISSWGILNNFFVEARDKALSPKKKNLLDSLKEMFS